jgi:hypothetical protein
MGTICLHNTQVFHILPCGSNVLKQKLSLIYGLLQSVHLFMDTIYKYSAARQMFHYITSCLLSYSVSNQNAGSEMKPLT